MLIMIAQKMVIIKDSDGGACNDNGIFNIKKRVIIFEF